MMRVMGISLLIPAMIRPGIAAASAASASGTSGTRRVMTVTAVATETAVRLALIQSTGIGYLIARRIPG